MPKSNKWDTIRKISQASDRYGNKLLELMEKCGANNLSEVPEETAEEFLREILKSKK